VQNRQAGIFGITSGMYTFQGWLILKGHSVTSFRPFGTTSMTRTIQVYLLSLRVVIGYFFDGTSCQACAVNQYQDQEAHFLNRPRIFRRRFRSCQFRFKKSVNIAPKLMKTNEKILTNMAVVTCF